MIFEQVSQVHVSKSLQHLEARICKIYKLEKYNNVNQPALFFGMYNELDYKLLNDEFYQGKQRGYFEVFHSLGIHGAMKQAEQEAEADNKQISAFLSRYNIVS